MPLAIVEVRACVCVCKRVCICVCVFLRVVRREFADCAATYGRFCTTCDDTRCRSCQATLVGPNCVDICTGNTYVAGGTLCPGSLTQMRTLTYKHTHSCTHSYTHTHAYTQYTRTHIRTACTLDGFCPIGTFFQQNCDGTGLTDTNCVCESFVALFPLCALEFALFLDWFAVRFLIVFFSQLVLPLSRNAAHAPTPQLAHNARSAGL